MIGLNIIVMPARARNPMPDPIFFLAGGPGQGAARIARAGEDALMRALSRERDLVFIDQRGTGDSHLLQCPTASNPPALQSSFRDIFDPAMVRACRQRLEQSADLELYTTSIAMSDVDEVRQALGYGKINLYGISYGSLSALEYLRRYPDRVRAAVLVGVATPAAKLPLQFAKGAQQALDKLIDDCALDPGCRSAFPRLSDDFAAALRAFSHGPLSFEITSPKTKRAEMVTMSRGVFTERLRLMLYDHAASSLVPYLIHRAARGDWLPFGKVVATTTLASSYAIALGAYLTITCSESMPFIAPEEIQSKTAETFIGDYRVLRHQGACAEWVRGEVPADFFRPVEADAPVLMLSGNIDPATPLELGKEAAQHLPNSRQIVLANAPHIYSSNCARALAVEFIAKASARNLNTTCNEPMRRPRFLTELPERYR
jgi:pimeloyl-ACP methyl ester carboxylesterase